MITPVHTVQPANALQAVQAPQEVKPDPQAQTTPVQKSGALSNDQVTLKSAGQPDGDTAR